MKKNTFCVDVWIGRGFESYYDPFYRCPTDDHPAFWSLSPQSLLSSGDLVETFPDLENPTGSPRIDYLVAYVHDSLVVTARASRVPCRIDVYRPSIWSGVLIPCHQLSSQLLWEVTWIWNDWHCLGDGSLSLDVLSQVWTKTTCNWKTATVGFDVSMSVHVDATGI
jgi:hypothetical protein